MFVLGRDLTTGGEHRSASQLPRRFISDLHSIMLVRPGGLDPFVLYRRALG